MKLKVTQMQLDGWLVFNIGCIECGVSSNVVGIFDKEEDAKRIASQLDKKHYWREHGQNSYEVFWLGGDMPEEYVEALKQC